MKNLTKLFTAILIGVSLIACTKTEKGPKGDKGDKGDQGAPGINGTNGTNGTNGNANVVSYKTVVSSWGAQSTYWAVTIPISELSSSALNNNTAVLCYFSTNNGASWFAMPYTQVDATSNYYLYFATIVSGVTVFWQRDNGALGISPNSYYGASVNIKTVVIPPAMVKPNINVNNYNEVKTAYNLVD